MSVTLHGPDGPPGVGPAPAAAPQTPSQRIVQKANELTYVTDELGRTIGWGKLDALADFDLCEIAGANNDNRAWMARATIAFSVREIDGTPVPRPANKTGLRALVARLGDAGMVAVGRSIFGEGDVPEGEGDGENAESPEMARAKNSAGTPASE